MASHNGAPFVAVDIGNSRIKFGLFDSFDSGPLPAPTRTFGIAGDSGDLAQLDGWLRPYDVTSVKWRIASVNRPATTRLVDFLRERGAQHQTRLLCAADLPLEVPLAHPDRVGIDRLAGAVAANVLRAPNQAVAIVDLGTAITVDLLSAAGAFVGGAILPGIGMSARALHEFTDLLPLLNMEALTEPPAAVGTSTLDAMRSGLYWGAIGAARELIAQFERGLGQSPQVFLTGGAAANVAGLVAPGAVYVPHLVLQGIALVPLVESHVG